MVYTGECLQVWRTRMSIAELLQADKMDIWFWLLQATDIGYRQTEVSANEKAWTNKKKKIGAAAFYTSKFGAPRCFTA